MKTINVDGLPDPIIRSLEVMVQTFCKEICTEEKPRERVKLSTRKGKVLGDLTREEIYKDESKSLTPSP